MTTTDGTAASAIQGAMSTAAGKFDIEPRPEPPFSTENGVMLGRMEFDKTFHGPLQGTSVVHMTYARTPVESSAGYVAVERIEGELGGRSGSFVVLHNAVQTSGDVNLSVSIVPDSGTGDLEGITGTMVLNADGEHTYQIEYELG